MAKWTLQKKYAIIYDSVKKILEDNPGFKLHTALVWAVHAKNCLHMNSGYSSYQLLFGQNPNLPSVLTDRPPALQETTISQEFAKHLNAMHSSRRVFIRAELSGQICWALKHQIRVKGQIFISGDAVQYKRPLGPL